MTHDAIGNISWKQDVGNYTYHATKRRTVIATGSHTFGYAANGNLTSRDGSTISYTSYNLPGVINAGSNSSTLSYGAFRNRYKQVAVTAGVTETTIHIGGLLNKVTQSGVTEYRHGIDGGNGTAAIYVRRTSSTPLTETYYVQRDSLGSPELITNAAGAFRSRPMRPRQVLAPLHLVQPAGGAPELGGEALVETSVCGSLERLNYSQPRRQRNQLHELQLGGRDPGRGLLRVAEQACGDTRRNIRDDLRRIKLARLSSPSATVWRVTEPAPDALQGIDGADDLDAVIVLDSEYVCIARDDQLGARGEGRGEHSVVVGIGRNAGGDVGRDDQPGEQSVAVDELRDGQACGLELAGELLSRQEIEQLVEQDGAGDQLDLLLARGDEEAAGRSVSKQSGDNGVGIKNDAHAVRLLRPRSRPGSPARSWAGRPRRPSCP